MKSITQYLSGQTMLWIPLYFIYKKKKRGALFTLLFITTCATGCYQHFYRTNSQQTTSADILQRLQASQKFFVIHFPDRNIGLQNVTINQNNIEGDEILLPASHTGELNPRIKGTNTVKKSDKDSVLTEVHLYTANTSTSKGRIAIPIAEINRMDVYEYDRNATRSNHTLSTLGVVITSVLVVSLATLAIACNCPQVYVEKDGASQFNGGMYSGAIYSTLERTDYMPLPMVRTSDNKLKLSVNNAPEEEQFINSLQLMQVKHSSDEKVLLDRHGKALSYKTPVPADFASAGLQNDKQLLHKKDSEVYAFNNNTNSRKTEVVLRFPQQNNNSQKGKLIIHGKNSAWSGFIFKEFSSLFGEGAEQWRINQEKADPKKLESWQKEQALPIMVYIKDGDSWRFVDYFPLVGNTASRDMIMEFDVPKNSSTGIEIKMETVYRFWDLDYAGIDLSSGEVMQGELTDPYAAVLKDGSDQKNALAENDKVYTELKNKDGVQLEFNLTQAPGLGEEVSYFLVSRGYYHNLQKFTGKAKTSELLPFRKEGAFDNFSRSKYAHVNNELAKFVVKEKAK